MPDNEFRDKIIATLRKHREGPPQGWPPRCTCGAAYCEAKLESPGDWYDFEEHVADDVVATLVEHMGPVF
jgi:hypothetical protein